MDLHEALNEELVVFARQVLLDVVRAKYMDSVHTGQYSLHKPRATIQLPIPFCGIFVNVYFCTFPPFFILLNYLAELFVAMAGKIGSSVMASKILLFSVDTAQDHIHDALLDWSTIEAALTPSSSLLYALYMLDEVFLRIFSVHAGLVGLLDAFNERNALYVLINYIDAHEYALDKLQFILGYDSANTETNNGADRELRQSVAALSSGYSGSYSSAANFSRLEAHQVILETVASVSVMYIMYVFGLDICLHVCLNSWNSYFHSVLDRNLQRSGYFNCANCHNNLYLWCMHNVSWTRRATCSR